MSILPRIMVAPNGARRGKADHAALPVTLDEITATARACHAAGAGSIHAHLRDERGRHLLDAGAYRELIDEMARAVPEMPVQITTEAGGRYGPAEQRALLDALTPEGASAALREILGDDDRAAAQRFYHTAAEMGVPVQHILYEPAEIEWLATEIAAGTVPTSTLQLLFALGRYEGGPPSDPAALRAWLDALTAQGLVGADWALCAFGPAETACLAAALEAGGKARVGFENSFFNADGGLARDNAERVSEIAALL
ncbi:MAG: 3-keto-5-aminohexanoate cleavage protein [Pararhodobacter sp.]|nr:3-keto-5-aminohexanoate cleavage protein [Pararhodobacter sp.]